MTNKITDIPWHTMQVDEVIGNVVTNVNTGLNLTEVEDRLRKYGYNQLEEKEGVSPIMLFLSQFNDFIVWVLIAAAIVSGFMGELVDTLAIIGFIQEYRAEKSFAELKKMSAPFSKVLRNGEMHSIPSRDIVPGDIDLLEAGDYVPADGRLCSSFSLWTQEASLTGESTPVGKSTEPLENPSLPIGDRENMMFMGTSVTSGKGTCVIVATGMRTELGKIAGLIQEAGKEETPLQRKLEVFGKKLVYLCLGIVTIVFLLELWRKDPLLEAFLTSVSLAVAAIPEGLPAIVTIALALGVQRMVKRHVLIRKLPSVETLGCATVICSDKTGTLTQNEMTVRNVFANNKTFDVSGTGYSPEGKFSVNGMPFTETDQRILKFTLGIGTLCNNAYLKKDDNTWKIIGDPTEGAILIASAKADIWKELLEKDFPLISEIPFDSNRKKMTTVRNTPHSTSLVCEKGAPDVILKDCTKILINGTVRNITESDVELILNENYNMTGNAMRVLGIAFKTYEQEKIGHASEVVEKDMIFAGLLAMIDPPRPEARRAVATCHNAGITTIMITGDHKNTAVAIGKELGFLRNKSKAIDGMELDMLSYYDLLKEVQNIAIYARVTAEHKLKIVKAWKKLNSVVAMTGDGVNDAPAVKEASIGGSMGITGTDVTKEASDMVITDDNFASIVSAVEEGRGIYDNIKKSIHYLLSCNAGEILTMLFASIFNLPLPLFPIQILWINIATDGLPALALGVDPVDPDIMKRPARRSTEQIVDKKLGSLIIFQGFLIAFSTLFAYLYVLYDTSCATLGCLHWFTNEVLPCALSGDIDRARTVAFCVMVVSQLFHSFNCRNTRLSLFKVGVFTNKKLLLATGLSLAMQIAIVYTPYLENVFKVTPLDVKDWITVFGFSSFTFVIMEIIKSFKRKNIGFQPSNKLK